MKHIGWWLCLFVVLVCSDQLTKIAITTAIAPGEYMLFFSFASLAHTLNPGIAFGVLLPLWLQYTLIIGIAFFLFHLWKGNKNPYFRLGIVCVSAGGASNVIDKILFGGIRDIIHLHGFTIFNLADIWILTGVALIGYNLFLTKQKVA